MLDSINRVKNIFLLLNFIIYPQHCYRRPMSRKPLEYGYRFYHMTSRLGVK